MAEDHSACSRYYEILCFLLILSCNNPDKTVLSYHFAMLMDFSHFSLHCKLPFLIPGIEVLNMDCKVREHCRLPHTCPQLFYLPLRIHFCQNLLPEEVNLLYVLQQGKKFLMNKKEEFLFTLFHDFPPQRRA